MTTSSEGRSFRLQFISDNTAPICPQAWEAMQHANTHPDLLHAVAYGDDPTTVLGAEQLALLAAGMSEDHAERLEERLASRPGDLHARTKLVAHYGGGSVDGPARDSLGRHVRWLRVA